MTERTHGPSAWRLLVDVIVRPWDAFRAIAQEPRFTWWLPAFLIILATVILMVVQAPHAAEEARRQMAQQLSTLPPEQAEIVRQQAERFTTPTVVLVSGTLTAVILTPLIWLLMAGVLYALVFIGGGEASFRTAWDVTPWTNLPFVLRHLVQAVWIWTHQDLLRYPGLSGWVASGDWAADTRHPLVALLAQVDVPGLWHVALVYWALRGAFRLSRPAALGLTAVYTLIMLAVGTVPTLLARALT